MSSSIEFPLAGTFVIILKVSKNQILAVLYLEFLTVLPMKSIIFYVSLKYSQTTGVYILFSHRHDQNKQKFT